MPTDPLRNIPSHIASEIRQIWAAEVAGGRAQYDASRSRVGVVGQWKVSRLLKSHGIMPGTDGRWEEVRDHGRTLYYGRATP